MKEDLNDGRASGLEGNRYGFHRVIEPPGAMPQAAWRIDNRPVLYDNEILMDVEVLNVDSASFAQLRTAADGDPQRVAAAVTDIVRQRGKLHNPVTGSGGMLIGRVAAVGPRNPHFGQLHPGTRIATLVSLSLTPLQLREIRRVDMANGQLDVDATAVLFESGIFAKMPDDIPDRVALAVFDVCGAPAQTARIVNPGDAVVILGAGGKSGLTVLRQARLSAGRGPVIAVDCGEAACDRVRRLGYADAVLNLDATRPADVYAAVRDALARLEPQEREGGTRPVRTTGGRSPSANEGPRLADVVINCVNVPGTEMSSILCARDRGMVYFFSMATSFTAAALGAEGVGKDVDLVMGNGYCAGHAEHALQLLREAPELLAVFEEKFAASGSPSAAVGPLHALDEAAGTEKGMTK
ncbi:MAG: L-erythro-3,5-diaminohexanoate dehydrogenase [Alicyclobacillus sp.]|nr:L-erythro-3,5-diaminohexanoate dehydrogenase [Alicyclobacillus sp.]